jgi:hypothetical protein
MKLRQRLKELENESSALKGTIYEALEAINKVLVKIEQLKEDSENAEHKQA